MIPVGHLAHITRNNTARHGMGVLALQEGEICIVDSYPDRPDNIVEVTLPNREGMPRVYVPRDAITESDFKIGIGVEGHPITVRANPIGTGERGRYDYVSRRGKLYCITPGGCMTIDGETQDVIETDECRRISEAEAKRFMRAYSGL